MKYYIVIFLSFVYFFNANAQSTESSNVGYQEGDVDIESIMVKAKEHQGGLSESEFLIAKEAYIKMFKSDTYTLLKKNNKIFIKKKKGLKLPSNDKKWMVDLNYTRTWLENNIDKTNFSSADEALELLKQSLSLVQKLMIDNAEVYELLKKANNNQIMQLLELERDYNHKMNQ